MKLVLLAGGYGTRISEETHKKPKPLIKIGTKPIIWHIMKIYNFYKINEFIICGGYKCNVIEQYFKENSFDELDINIIDTGLDTMTGGRLKRIESYVNDTFCLTYGDGLSDVDINKLIKFHRSHGKTLTITGVRPPGRFGEMKTNEKGQVLEFNEKPQASAGRISGGFFVASPKLFDYLNDNEDLVFEQEPMRKLVSDNELMMYEHDGFWQPMDTNREYRLLNSLYDKGEAPWTK